MAKPSITKRITKSAALTYSELDTNFQNLADATLTLRAGTGGTNVTADLNGTITLVAGTNVTLTGDNSAKTITINSSGGGGSGTVTSPLTIEDSVNTNNEIILTADDSTYFGDVATIKTGSTNDLLVITTNSGNCRIYIPNSGDYVAIQASALKPIRFPEGITHHFGISTISRNNITSPQSGMMIYNLTDNKFQGYANGAWVDLH